MREYRRQRMIGEFIFKTGDLGLVLQALIRQNWEISLQNGL